MSAVNDAPPDFEYNEQPLPIENVHIRLGIGICHDVCPWSTVHMSPLWGFGYLVYAACYKHVAPLGLNAPVFLSSKGLGDLTPTNSIVR